MPASQSAVSTSSSSSVAGQHLSPSLDDSQKRSTTLWLPLSPFPSYSWDVQEDLENDQRSDESGASSPPRTPGLSWDSAPSSSELPDDTLKSVFEDWEDPEIPNSSVYLEEDGSQVLLITPQSAFFQPPPTPAPFGHEPFSNDLFPDNDTTTTSQTSVEVPQSLISDVPLTPVTLENSENVRPGRGRVLYVDTTYQSFGKEWSASIFFSPKLADEAASWAPQEFGCGPDVPLDCIYSAGDVSPVERCDEKMWSPILRKALHTAPCV